MPDISHLAGKPFPGGTYMLESYVNWLWSDAVLAQPQADVAHPGLAYLVATQGCGLSFQDIFDLAGADAESGVLFGETGMSFEEPLRPGVLYHVDGEFTEAVRREGRRAGVFDALSFELRVRENPAGDPVARVWSTWIFPRAA
jgi:hypothetical protein